MYAFVLACFLLFETKAQLVTQVALHILYLSIESTCYINIYHNHAEFTCGFYIFSKRQFISGPFINIHAHTGFGYMSRNYKFFCLFVLIKLFKSLSCKVHVNVYAFLNFMRLQCTLLYLCL